MSQAGRPGAGAAIGLVVTLGAVGLLGLAAWRAIDGDLAGKWIYAGVAGGLVALHLLAFAGSVKLVTRGVASVAYLMMAVTVALLAVGVDHDGAAIAFGLRFESLIPWVLALLVTAGAIALPAMPSSTPGRVIGGLAALAAVAPWWIGAVSGATPEAILGGAGRFYEPWPTLAQPALIGGALALGVLLLAGVAILGGRGHPDQRILAVCALAIPGVAGALMAAYVLHPDGAARPDAAVDAAPAIDAGVVAARPDAAAPQPRLSCAAAIRPGADVSAIRDGFTPARWRESAIAFLQARFPDAVWMIGLLEDPESFGVWFEGQTGDWGSMMLALGTGVHETAHIAGLQSRGRRHRYIIGRDDYVDIQPPKSFDRSEIAARLPPEIRELSYTETYLTGKSGAQGYEMVLEELNAYTYSLYVAIITLDQMPPGISTSGRDGLLTLMVYTETYLALARESRPDTYAAITGDDEVVAATIKLYDRAACVLELSGADRRIGIDDEMLREHVFGARRLGEIDRLR